ncbi:MAG: GGDEF domain-containing protein [Oscillospiraceae bacterium]|nr:GGDEF domain-containing protein [Oscillospiraceae bacterium]
MNPILILRCEIVCAVIMIFFFIYSIIYSKDKGVHFRHICVIAFLHLIFDGITVFTVNNTDTIPENLNFIFHFFMYGFAAWATCEVCYYMIDNIWKTSLSKLRGILFRIPLVLYVILVPFTNINYLEGNGTFYSMGIGAIIGFGLAVIYLIVGTLLTIINYRKAEKGILTALVPMNICAVITIAVQVIVPELLFTGALITLMMVGLFFAVENPAAHYMKRAFIDLGTGIKNKNCYEEDLKQLEKKKLTDIKFVICDLNCLKFVNDNLGHIKGDELIRTAADILSASFKSSYGVYRVGGDEFTAIYINGNTVHAEKEISAARSECDIRSTPDFPLSIAMGCSSCEKGNVRNFTDIIEKAEKLMYEDKKRIKKENPNLGMRT